MSRLPSDHDEIETHRAVVVRRGGTRRPAVRLPGEFNQMCGLMIRLYLSGDVYYTQPVKTTRGALFRGAYDNRRLARTPDEGENRLVSWLNDHTLEFDDPLDCDVIEDNDQLGLRLPGERVVYDAPSGPADSLADIARDLDG